MSTIVDIILDNVNLDRRYIRVATIGANSLVHNPPPLLVVALESSAALPVVQGAEPEAATGSDNASPVLIVIRINDVVCCIHTHAARALI